MKREDRVKLFVDYFSEHLPKAETELIYESPYQLTVAVILSAQCTDKRVNITTPEFFRVFPEPETLALANVEEVFKVIRSISYPNNKAKHLVGMAKSLINDFNGQFPHNVNDLMKIPGIGRKSANVLAAVLFDIPTMPVDTHVFRVARRIGLTLNAKNVNESEKQLVKYIPKNKMNLAHHWLVLHGRYVCIARKPKCEICGLTPFCKYFNELL